MKASGTKEGRRRGRSGNKLDRCPRHRVYNTVPETSYVDIGITGKTITRAPVNSESLH